MALNTGVTVATRSHERRGRSEGAWRGRRADGRIAEPFDLTPLFVELFGDGDELLAVAVAIAG
jgi:hypothetical protein